MNIPFRWNPSETKQLGSLIQGERSAIYPQFHTELRECVARVLTISGERNIYFIGRSPESIHDYLNGILSGTSYQNWCEILNISIGSQVMKTIALTNPHGLTALRQHLTDRSLAPRQILRRPRPVAFVDLVMLGSTFTNIANIYENWSTELGIDFRVVARQLRFVGITEREQTSPNTWRWYQESSWLQRFPRNSTRGLSISWDLWRYLGDNQDKVALQNSPEKWGTEALAKPPRSESNIKALRLAVDLYNLGKERNERQKFCASLGRSGAFRQRWLRQLAIELRRPRA